MFSPVVRIIGVVFGLAMAWKSYSNGDMEIMLLALFSVVLLAWGYFKSGSVFMAFRELKRQNFKKAEEILSKTKNPNSSSKGQRAYYHFIKGFIELHKGNTNKCFSELTKASELGLRTEHDTAIVTLNLATIEVERNNYEEAMTLLEKTKKLNHKPGLKAEINRVENELIDAQHG